MAGEHFGSFSKFRVNSLSAGTLSVLQACHLSRNDIYVVCVFASLRSENFLRWNYDRYCEEDKGT